MRATKMEVNRVQDGCEVNEIEADLRAIEEDGATGPGAGFGAKSLYITKSIEAAHGHVNRNPTCEVMAEACAALGSVLAGSLAAQQISDKEYNSLRERFVAKVADGVDAEYGEDAYDIASAAFDRGAEKPRTDLGDIASQQKQDSAERQRAYRPRRTNDDTDVLAQSIRTEDRVGFILEALSKTEEGDPGALFANRVLAEASHLPKEAPAENQRLRAKIKDLGPDVLKEWDKALRKHEAAARAETKRQETLIAAWKSAFAAKGGRAGEAAKEDIEAGEPLDGRTAYEYGTMPGFDPSNEYMCGELLRLQNTDYAVVSIGGDFRVLEITKDGRVVLHRLEALRQKFENIRVPVPGKAQLANSFDVWMKWPDRKTYDGIGFYPGSTKCPAVVPKGHFNTWRGFAVEARKGTWPLLYDHMLDVYCGGDEDLLCWLLDWVAQMIQEPQRKTGTSVVFRSRTEGTGKSLFAHVMRKILGGAVLSASRADQVAGRFNSHLQNTLLLVAEEALYAGSKTANGILKDLVTCPDMAYEAKGLPIIFAPNYTRVLFISNEAHVVPAGPTSRRFAVFDCENPNANDKSYFDPLFTEIDSGGAEAFLYEMSKRKIASDLRMPPITKGLLEQREMSVDGFGRWLLSAAKSGQLRVPDNEGGRTVELSVAVDLGAAISFDDLRASARPYLDQFEQRAVDHKLGAQLKSVGARRGRLPKSSDRSRPWGYEFPPLAEFRKAVGRQLGVVVVVEPDIDEHTDSDRTSPRGSKVVPFDAVKRTTKALRASLR